MILQSINEYASARAMRIQNKMRYSYSVLPLGTVNLKSGHSPVFNVYDTWKGGSTAEIWEVGDWKSGERQVKYKIVFSAGSGVGKMGEQKNFIHDQTFRDLFYGKLIDKVSLDKLSEWGEKNNLKTASGYVYK